MTNLNINLNQDLENYILKIDYKVSYKLADAWSILASDEGFTKWFPQLHIEKISSKLYLVFEVEDFREEMEILEFQENKSIAYAWDLAKVRFSIEEVDGATKINFEEVMPKDYQSEYSDAKKDMTGWLVQNHYLSEIMNGMELVEKEELKGMYEDKLSHLIGGLK